MPLNATDMKAAFASLTVFKDRTPTSSGPDFEKAFKVMAKTETGGVFAASFQGNSAWECHPNGDELVQVVSGRAKVTILQGDEENVLDMKSGMFVIVPRNCWHRFESPDGVEVMTMTPQPTDHWREDSLPPKR